MSSPCPRARRRAAPAAGASMALEDPGIARRGSLGGRAPASGAGCASHHLECEGGRARRATARQGFTPARKHASAFQRFPIPAMLRWSSRASAMPRVGSSWRRRRRNAPRVELRGEDVGSEPREALVEPRPRLRHQLEHGPVELHHLVSGVRITSQARRGLRSSAVRGRSPHMPAHAQVGVEREVALEAHEQVLPVGVHRPHRPAVPAARANGPWRGAAGGSRSPSIGLSPSERCGCGWPRSGSCRLRAWGSSEVVRVTGATRAGRPGRAARRRVRERRGRRR